MVIDVESFQGLLPGEVIFLVIFHLHLVESPVTHVPSVTKNVKGKFNPAKIAHLDLVWRHEKHNFLIREFFKTNVLT
jgi:phosphatidylserine decarboxylase